MKLVNSDPTAQAFGLVKGKQKCLTPNHVEATQDLETKIWRLVAVFDDHTVDFTSSRFSEDFPYVFVIPRPRIRFASDNFAVFNIGDSLYLMRSPWDDADPIQSNKTICINTPIFSDNGRYFVKINGIGQELQRLFPQENIPAQINKNIKACYMVDGIPFGEHADKRMVRLQSTATHIDAVARWDPFVRNNRAYFVDHVTREVFRTVSDVKVEADGRRVMQRYRSVEVEQMRTTTVPCAKTARVLVTRGEPFVVPGWRQCVLVHGTGITIGYDPHPIVVREVDTSAVPKVPDGSYLEIREVLRIEDGIFCETSVGGNFFYTQAQHAEIVGDFVIRVTNDNVREDFVVTTDGVIRVRDWESIPTMVATSQCEDYFTIYHQEDGLAMINGRLYENVPQNLGGEVGVEFENFLILGPLSDLLVLRPYYPKPMKTKIALREPLCDE